MGVSLTASVHRKKAGGGPQINLQGKINLHWWLSMDKLSYCNHVLFTLIANTTA